MILQLTQQKKRIVYFMHNDDTPVLLRFRAASVNPYLNGMRDDYVFFKITNPSPQFFPGIENAKLPIVGLVPPSTEINED